MNNFSKNVQIFLTCLIIFSSVSGSSAQQAIKVESALVSVPVIVTDEQGKLLSGLKAENFNLFQDDALVDISHFYAIDDPLTVALLIDTSQSAGPILDNIKKAALRFLAQMRPQDRAAVVSFDTEVHNVCPLSSDRKELTQAINGVRTSGSQTRMRDAISEIANKRFRSVRGRKAVVLLTDGQDHGSSVSPSELLDEISESSLVVYTIFYSVDPDRLVKELFGTTARNRTKIDMKKEDVKAADFLGKICEFSGGRFFRSSVMELDKAFRQISNELRSQYLLGFYPDASKLDGESHSLDVKVPIPNAIVRSRHGYRAAKMN